MLKHIAYFLWLASIFAPPLQADAAPPQIANVTPLALAPGTTTRLTIRGQGLQDARSLWTTFAARCEFSPGDDDSEKKGETLVCRLTVPREVQLGVGALRVITGEGVSNPVLAMIDDLPTIAEVAANHTLDDAQPIESPIAIDGQCDSVEEDMFRFHAVAGQRLTFEIVSQRLGSKLDAIMRIFEPGGAEIVRLDDAEGSGGDTRFAHTFSATGDYVVALRDVRYAGGSEYRYRLRVGSFPLVTAVYPAGGRSGAVTSFELLTQSADASRPVHVILPAVANTPRLVSYSVPGSEDAGSGWFQVEANPASESLDQEPNDEVAVATAVEFPSAINGRLDKSGDRDIFKFSATKGQRVLCVAKTRELGSPCDLHMSLHKADASRIAVARQDRQTTLDAQIPEDGQYFLHVEDLLAAGQPGHVYRIDMTDLFAGVLLHTEQTQYTAPHAGTCVVKVLAQRRGFSDPIELAVEGLGEGVTLEGSKLEGGEALLKITLPPTIAQGEMRLAKIIGRVTVGERVFSIPMGQQVPLAAMFPNTLSLPTELESTVAIGVGPPFPPFFDLSVKTSEVYFPLLVGMSTFDIDVTRSNDAFKEAIAISIEGLPQGIEAKVARVDDGLKAYRVTLQGPADLNEQEVPVRVVGTARFQEQSRTVTLANLKLQVTKPLVVSLTVPAPITTGGSQLADVQLQRFGDNPQPVRLQVTDGPAGVSAPIITTIPADVSQIKIPLAADASAPAGRFDNLVVVASTTVQGQNVSVHSKPANVEILPKTAE